MGLRLIENKKLNQNWNLSALKYAIVIRRRSANDLMGHAFVRRDSKAMTARRKYVRPIALATVANRLVPATPTIPNCTA